MSVNDCLDDGAECRSANHDADGQIDHVPLQRKRLELCPQRNRPSSLPAQPLTLLFLRKTATDPERANLSAMR
jgi:hypothetical protein